MSLSGTIALTCPTVYGNADGPGAGAGGEGAEPDMSVLHGLSASEPVEDRPPGLQKQ